VTPGYFQTMGLSLQAGRDFTWQETPKKDRGFAKVAVINKTLAQQYKVGLAPGEAFAAGGPGNIRLCFASGAERLSQGG